MEFLPIILLAFGFMVCMHLTAKIFNDIINSRSSNKPYSKPVQNYLNFEQKKYYAMYQRGGFRNPSHHFIIHAFFTEDERNEFIHMMNNSNRKLYNEFETYAIIVTSDDAHVKEALQDVKNNPLIYNNIGYINNRVYVEHNNHYPFKPL